MTEWFEKVFGPDSRVFPSLTKEAMEKESKMADVIHRKTLGRRKFSWSSTSKSRVSKESGTDNDACLLYRASGTDILHVYLIQCSIRMRMHRSTQLGETLCLRRSGSLGESSERRITLAHCIDVRRAQARLWERRETIGRETRSLGDGSGECIEAFSIESR